MKREFRLEMQRFLPAAMVATTVNNEQFWGYLAAEIPALIDEVALRLSAEQSGPTFLM